MEISRRRKLNKNKLNYKEGKFSKALRMKYIITTTFILFCLINCTTLTMFEASSQGNVDAVRKLIENKADVNEKYEKDWTPLHLAANDGHFDVAKLLVEKGADVNAKNKFGWTSLNLAVNQGHFDVAKLLVEKGTDINTKDDDGETPLHLAANKGNLEMTKFLVEKGANINEKNKDGKTPLHLAANKGNFEVTKSLVEKGADVNAKNNVGEIPLFTAIEKEHKSNEDKKREAYFKPELIEIHNNCVKVVKFLIENKTDLNAKEENDETPLQLAIENNQIEVATFLIENGADINFKGKDDITPLHQAATRDGHFEIAKLLVEKGADVNAKTNAGETPLDLTRNQKIASLLTSKEGKVTDDKFRQAFKNKKINSLKWSEYQGIMNWYDAKVKCNSIGMRLPTEFELINACQYGIAKKWDELTYAKYYHWSVTAFGYVNYITSYSIVNTKYCNSTNAAKTNNLVDVRCVR